MAAHNTSAVEMPAREAYVIIVYPTISPKVVVIPIVSCIIVFPIIVLMVICSLRYRAIRNRRFDKRSRGRLELTAAEHAGGRRFSRCNDETNEETDEHLSNSDLSSVTRNDGESEMAQTGKTLGRQVIHCKNGKRKTIVRFKPMPELDLDTVIEERSEFDAEVNANELLQNKVDSNHLQVLKHPVSFRSFRYGYNATGELLKKGDSTGGRKAPGSPLPKTLKKGEDNEISPNSSRCSSLSTTNNRSSSPSTVSPSTITFGLSNNTSKSPTDAISSCDIEMQRFDSPEKSHDNSSGEENIDDCSLEVKGSFSNVSFIIPSVSIQSYSELNLSKVTSPTENFVSVVNETASAEIDSPNVETSPKQELFQENSRKILGRNSICVVDTSRGLLELGVVHTPNNRRKSFPNFFVNTSSIRPSDRLSKRRMSSKPTQLDLQINNNIDNNLVNLCNGDADNIINSATIDNGILVENINELNDLNGSASVLEEHRNYDSDEV